MKSEITVQHPSIGNVTKATDSLQNEPHEKYAIVEEVIVLAGCCSNLRVFTEVAVLPQAWKMGRVRR